MKEDSIKKVHKVCLAISKLTDEDFAEVRKMAEQQSEYFHPLKNGTAQLLNKRGKNNSKIINALVGIKRRIELFETM